MKRGGSYGEAGFFVLNQEKKDFRMSRIGLKGKKMLEIIHDPDYPCIFPFLVF